MNETNLTVAVGKEWLRNLEADAARWRYVRDNLAQASGPKMDGNWTWRFRFPGGGTARTIDELIDRLIAQKSDS